MSDLPVWLFLAGLAIWHLTWAVLGGICTWAALAGRYHVDRWVRRQAKRTADVQRARAHQLTDDLAEARTENARLWQAFDAAAPDACRATLQRISAPAGGES